MTKEHAMNFYVSEAKMYFEIENVDGEDESVVETSAGYDLLEKICQYKKQEFDNLFANEELPVFYARLKCILITHEQDGVKFNLKLNGDEGAYASLTFKPETLMDENANKIAMIREVLDFDPEAETSLLRELIKCQ